MLIVEVVGGKHQQRRGYLKDLLIDVKRSCWWKTPTTAWIEGFVDSGSCWWKTPTTAKHEQRRKLGLEMNTWCILISDV